VLTPISGITPVSKINLSRARLWAPREAISKADARGAAANAVVT